MLLSEGSAVTGVLRLGPFDVGKLVCQCGGVASDDGKGYFGADASIRDISGARPRGTLIS